MHRSRHDLRIALSVCIALSCAAISPVTGHAMDRSPTVRVHILVSAGLPLAFESASITSWSDQAGRGLLTYRVTNSASEDLESYEVTYAIFRPDGSARGGGTFVRATTIPAKSWLEHGTLLNIVVTAGDRVVLSLVGASTAATTWQTDRSAVFGAAAKLNAGRPTSLPSACQSPR